jgi:hypothetical protein
MRIDLHLRVLTLFHPFSLSRFLLYVVSGFEIHIFVFGNDTPQAPVFKLKVTVANCYIEVFEKRGTWFSTHHTAMVSDVTVMLFEHVRGVIMSPSLMELQPSAPLETPATHKT